jgi:hypothetical protein
LDRVARHTSGSSVGAASAGTAAGGAERRPLRFD